MDLVPPARHHVVILLLQMGLWREGSYGISPGANSWAFEPGAWAMYARTDVSAVTVWQLRIDPMGLNRNVSLSLGSPKSIVATFCAACVAAPSGYLSTFNISLPGPLTTTGGLLFLLPDGDCIIDWFRFM